MEIARGINSSRYVRKFGIPSKASVIIFPEPFFPIPRGPNSNSLRIKGSVNQRMFFQQNEKKVFLLTIE